MFGDLFSCTMRLRTSIGHIFCISSPNPTILKCTRCTPSSSTTHLWTPEPTEVCLDHKVPLCFEVYYDWPVYPKSIIWKFWESAGTWICIKVDNWEIHVPHFKSCSTLVKTHHKPQTLPQELDPDLTQEKTRVQVDEA
jgi:hypothetical protein